MRPPTRWIPDEAGSPDEEDIAEKGVEAKNSPDEEKTPQ